MAQGRHLRHKYPSIPSWKELSLPGACLGPLRLRLSTEWPADDETHIVYPAIKTLWDLVVTVVNAEPAEYKNAVSQFCNDYKEWVQRYGQKGRLNIERSFCCETVEKSFKWLWSVAQKIPDCARYDIKHTPQRLVQYNQCQLNYHFYRLEGKMLALRMFITRFLFLTSWDLDKDATWQNSPTLPSEDATWTLDQDTARIISIGAGLVADSATSSQVYLTQAIRHDTKCKYYIRLPRLLLRKPMQRRPLTALVLRFT